MSDYPNSFDAFPLQTDGGSVLNAAQIQNIQDAVVAIESTLGLDPAGAAANLAEALEALRNDAQAKASVRAATTGSDVTLSGLQTIDGVSLVVGERVLVKDQTDATENGIYAVASGAWARTEDADAGGTKVVSGIFSFVDEGTEHAGSGFLLVTPNPVVLGTTELSFAQFTGGGGVLAGPGLSKSGSTLRIDVGYVGQTSIDTVGTIATGAWEGTPVDVSHGGSGASTASDARTNLGAAASGANSDITSLSGLTTPLSVGQGGSGASTASDARTNLGAAASGANSDVTSLSGLTTPLSVGQGGSGASTASDARTNLGAAASGANSDITSLSGLTTPLSASQGGTGATTGYSNPGSGSQSEHFGASSTASGLRAISLGNSSSASATDATSIGGYSQALSISASAFGAGSEADAQYDTALGAYAQASAAAVSPTGKGAVAVGYGALAYGDGSIAIGQDASTTATGVEKSIALGKGASPTASNQLKVGSASAPITNMSFGGSGCKISNVTDPSSAQDAATKNYVDLAVSGVMPTGSIVPFAGVSFPSGWLLCNGDAISRSVQAALFAALVTTKGAVTVAVASPAVVTLTGHGLSTGDAVYLETTGSLPTGLSPDTTYWVTVVNADTFKLATSYGNARSGTNVNTSGTQSGTHTLYFAPYGVSSATTFNLPDLRGRVPFGAGGGTPSTMGAKFGNENVTLAATDLPQHTHAIGGSTGSTSIGHTHTFSASATTGTDSPAHTHNYTLSFVTEGLQNATDNSRTYCSGATATNYTTSGPTSHSHSVSISGTSGSTDPAHTHTLPANTGNNTAPTTNPRVMQPSLTINFLIKT